MPILFAPIFRAEQLDITEVFGKICIYKENTMKKKLTILTVIIVAALFMYAGCDLLTGTYRGDIRILGTNGRLTLTISRYSFITRSGKYRIEKSDHMRIESGNIKIYGWTEKRVILSNRRLPGGGSSLDYIETMCDNKIMQYYTIATFDLSALL